MKNSRAIAYAIYEHLIDLAVNDKLPLDMTQLDVDKLEKVINRILPSHKVKYIENAKRYLTADSDKEISKMVSKIAKNKDKEEMIDYVDGVVVWENVENCFNCNTFLELIGYDE